MKKIIFAFSSLLLIFICFTQPSCRKEDDRVFFEVYDCMTTEPLSDVRIDFYRCVALDMELGLGCLRVGIFETVYTDHRGKAAVSHFINEEATDGIMLSKAGYITKKGGPGINRLCLQ